MVEQVVNNNVANGIVKQRSQGGKEEPTTKAMDSEKLNAKKEAYIEEDHADFGVFAVEYPDANVEEAIWPVLSKTENKPLVVVLLGWAGAIDKHLAKYSDIYLSRGCIVVRYTAPPKVVMYHDDQLPRLTAKLIERLKKFELDSHPMFFHLFSNGGGFTYSYMLAELVFLREHFDIRGTICDSAPAPRRIGGYYRALLTILQPNYGMFRYAMAAFMVCLLVVSMFWAYMKNAYRFLKHGDIIGFERWHPTHNWLGRISQYRKHNFLLIYSDADTIIPSHLVEKFAHFVEKNNNVKYLKFTDSAHVQHYRAYPEEYVGAITDFVREVMGAGENQTQYPTQY